VKKSETTENKVNFEIPYIHSLSLLDTAIIIIPRQKNPFVLSVQLGLR